MAFSSNGSVATAVGNSADQTSLAVGSVTAAINDFLVLLIGVDNNQTTDGDEGAVSGVTDSAGNTWHKAAEFTNGQGAAQAGATCSVWYTKVTAALSSGTVTAAFTNSSSRDRSGATIWGWAVGSDTVSIEGAPGTLANDGADPGSLDVTTANIECLRVRAIASETTGSGVSLTPTSGWTAFTQSVSSGFLAAIMGIRGEWNISTGTGDASDPALASADHASVYVAFKLTPPAALELDADGGTYALTGAAAGMDIERGLGAGAGVYSLSGAAAAVLHGRYIAAAGGSYSLTGAIAALLRHRSLAADAGTYALVGSAATLLHGGRFLAAGAGSYGLSGTAAALLVDRIIGAGGGVYSLTGADATMGILSDRVLGAGGGVYELTGLEASLGLEGALAAQPGVYAITGAPADAMLDRLLASGNTTYELVGDDADQVLDRLVAASAGSYLLSGADVGLSRVGVRTLEAQPGLYVLTGAAAGLSLAFNGIRAESGGYLIDGQPVSLFFVEKPDPVRRVLHVTRASRTAHVSRNNRTLFVPRRSN